MPLLKNAIDSLRIGLEDFGSDDSRRIISAVRNLHAGVLLLLKEKLLRLSPPESNDVLIMQRIVPALDADGRLTFVGSGKNTADAHTIEARLADLDIDVEWAAVRALTKIRNNIEHHSMKNNEAAVRAAIVNTCEIVRKFTPEHLSVNPAEELGEAWTRMLEIKELYDKELHECRAVLAAASWASMTLQKLAPKLTCDNCGSQLLRPLNDSENPSLCCRQCGEEEAAESYTTRAIAATYGLTYEDMRDGLPPCIGECPNCNHEAFVDEEEECALCGHTLDRDCALCGSFIPTEELYSHPYCGYCKHRMERVVDD